MLKTKITHRFSSFFQGLSALPRCDGMASVGEQQATFFHRACNGVYLGDHRVLTSSVHGARLILDTRDIILTPIILQKGEWEPETSRVLCDLLRPGMNFVDVGANIGYFTVHAGMRVRPGGKMWAFEADPVAFEFLCDNVNLNWFFDGVTLENKAIYSCSGEVNLFQRQKYRGNTSIAKIAEDDLVKIIDSQVELRVVSASLDEYFSNVNDRLDLVKIDVEGAEPYVLEGMRKLNRHQPNMNILKEWTTGQNDEYKRNPKEMLDMISQFNFKLQIVRDGLEAISFSDLRAIPHGMVLLTR